MGCGASSTAREHKAAARTLSELRVSREETSVQMSAAAKVNVDSSKGDQIFHAIDADKSGRVNLEELKARLDITFGFD